MKKVLLIPLLLTAGWLHADVTNLRIELFAGAESAHALSIIGKIVLSTDNLCLFDKEGTSLGCTPLDQIGKIVLYQDEATGIDEAVLSSIQVFPNPTREMLFVRGIKSEQTVRIYGLNGQLMLSASVSDGEAKLHVSGLQNGTYLLQIGAQVVKFIKE